MEITLALGGGGVKGYSHIGVMHYLEQCGVTIRAVAGTSAGGLFGALYSSGLNYAEMQERLEKLDQSKLFQRIKGDGPSLLGLSGVVSSLEEILGDRTFDELRIPMAMTALDLETGESVALRKGRLVDAILATIALPGVFPPKEWNGRLMVDGGVVDPVPVALARSMAPELPVVAVVLTPKIRSWNGHRTPPQFLNSFPMINRIYQFRLPQSLSIFLRSVDLANSYLTDLRLQMDSPDLIIRPLVHSFGVVGQVDIEQVVSLGEQAARQAFPHLELLMQQRNGWGNRMSVRLPWLGDILKKKSIDA